MYGQGNYAPPKGQGSYTNTPPFHQHLPAPPPLPAMSQGPHLPPPSVFQQGLSQVGHLGASVYSNASPGLPQSGPPNPVLSSTNNQPYLTTSLPSHPSQSLPVRGTSQMPQNSHWTPNASFVPSAVLPPPPRVLPPPPRVPPPLPSQGQTVFGEQVHQQATVSMQSPAPPHPRTSRFYVSPPVGSSDHLRPASMNVPVVPSPPPPPLPSSLPGSSPLPLSSSPPASSSPFSKEHTATPIPAASELTFHPNFGSGVCKSTVQRVAASGSIGAVSVSSSVSDYVSNGGQGFSSVNLHGENSSSDLPPAPPKPANERIVRRVELLCQFIARNGPEFENMTRLKEFENPEFKFLFGGEPGSEAAIAHEYFIWTKRKYNSVGKSRSSNSPSRQPGEFTSKQGRTVEGGVPSSPADSDMDMEDDITHPFEEPQSFSSEKQSYETVSLSSGLDKEQELQPFLTNAEPGILKDAVVENLTYSQHSESGSRERTLGSSEVDALNTHSSGNVGLPATVGETAAAREALGEPSTSPEPAEVKFEKPPNLVVKEGASSLKLLPDYASDESSGGGDHHLESLPTAFVPSVEVGSTSLHKDVRVDLGTDCETERILDKGLEWLSSNSYSSAKSESVVLGARKGSITGESKNFVDNRYQNKETLKDDIPQKESQQIIVSRDAVSGPVSNIENKKDPKNTCSMLKVDEFGRLVRENDSDSDSGSPRYNRRKRGRSRSRSRTPPDRRRRSPRRRNDRRGRSRSFSPKRRRSRSKSPPSRYVGDATRRDRRPECFDFIKGKCYRGASCRYQHHDDKSERSRSHRSRQQFQDSSRNSGAHERFEVSYKKFSGETNQGRNQELKRFDDLPISEEKKGIKEVMDGAPARFPEKGGDLEPSGHLTTNSKVENTSIDAAHGMPSAIEKSDLQQSQIHFSGRFLQNADQRQQVDAYRRPNAAPMEMPSSITSQLPTDETRLNEEAASQSGTTASRTFESGNISAQPMVPKEPVPPVSAHLSNVPTLFPSVSQPRDCNVAPSAAKFPSTGPVENLTPYPVSYAHSQFSLPPNQSWNSVPPPAQPHPHPAIINDTFLTPRPHGGAVAHFTHNMLPRRNDLYSQSSVRPYLSEFPNPANVGQTQGYPSLQEADLPPGNLDERQQSASAANQPITSQAPGGPGLAREDHFAGRPGIYPSSSHTQESSLSQAMPFLEDSISKRQSYPGDILLPGELSIAPQSKSILQQISAAGGISALHVENVNQISSLPTYTSNVDRNQSSVLSNLGISRISNHFNPYASTFDHPLSSKFSSNVLVEQKDQSFNSSTLGTALSQIHVEGRVVANLGSQPVEGVLPQLGRDQYDPLFDSIEPSLNSAGKSHYVKKHEIIDESDDTLRLSGSTKPLDREENKQKVGGASEASGSFENDEFGETADAEVGAVENGSPTDPLHPAGTGAGEVEIDQANTPGKSKKSKESRSMRLFKIAIANFVKEVLKPSWRQGNMSKEAFKTIVKKTVDRVSGAMKSHQIPKSKAKIDHYIDSSQRKLTKLVMGYVDKYVNV